MITLITKQEVNIPIKREIKNGKVRMEITSLYFNNEYIKVEGNYHWINENDEKEILDLINIYRPKQTIFDIETVLNTELTGINIYDLINQRLFEMALYQIQLESGENYGTTQDDWELI